MKKKLSHAKAAAPAAHGLVKISATGKELPITARSWVAVLDRATGLMFPAKLPDKALPWKDAMAQPLPKLAGFSDWRPATRKEGLSIIDDTRYSPTVDTRFFRYPKSGWVWLDTPDASDPGSCAWYVDLYRGRSYLARQGYEGLVLAVRGPVPSAGQ